MPSPELAKAGEVVMASRPSEINFLDEGGVPGVVTRKAFLGEVVDYAVDVAGTEVRVQKGRRTKGPKPGDVCHLDYLRPLWYPVDEEYKK